MGLFDVDEEQTQTEGERGLLGGSGLPGALSTANVVVKPLPGTTLDSIPAPYQPLGGDTLSEKEQQDLQSCKAGVDNLRNAFWVAGKSLETLSTAKLHREENPNFASWVWDNWEISESQLHRLMDEWRVGEALANLGHKPLESQVRMLTDVRRQTSDKVAITVYDTIARCVPRVTAKVVEQVVTELAPLPKDLEAAEAGRRVREVLQEAEKKSEREGHNAPVHDITSMGKDSPIGESGAEGSNGKNEELAAKDIERLTAAYEALKQAAKKVNKSAARRAVEAQPDVAVPLIEAIGTTLQQIDRAVAIRLPKQR